MQFHCRAMILSVFACYCLACGAISDSVRIAPFYNNKDGAISYTFDDGLSDHVRYVEPALNKYHLKGTFFIIAGLTYETDSIAALNPNHNSGGWGGISWQAIRRLAASGHEIGNHSWDHAYPTTWTTDTCLYREVNSACSLITAKVGIAPFTYCYPYNNWDPRIDAMVFQRHHASRKFQTDVGGGIQSGYPAYTLAMFNAVADSAVLTKQWRVVMMHGIYIHDWQSWQNLADTSILYNHLAYAASRQDKLWIATFGDASRYFQERDSTTITAQMNGSNSMMVRLNCRLDTTVYRFPLSVTIQIPGVQSAQAKWQNTNDTLPLTTKTGQICVNIIPHNAPVTITWSMQTSVIKRMYKKNQASGTSRKITFGQLRQSIGFSSKGILADGRLVHTAHQEKYSGLVFINHKQ